MCRRVRNLPNRPSHGSERCLVTYEGAHVRCGDRRRRRKDFTERSEHDRHHFRFINFPENGVEMPEHTGKASLNGQTRVAKSNRL